MKLYAQHLQVTCALILLCLCSGWLLYTEGGCAENIGPCGIARRSDFQAGCSASKSQGASKQCLQLALISALWININSNIVFPGHTQLTELLIIWSVAVHWYLIANWRTEKINVQLLTGYTGHWVSVTQLGYRFLCLKWNIKNIIYLFDLLKYLGKMPSSLKPAD